MNQEIWVEPEAECSSRTRARSLSLGTWSRGSPLRRLRHPSPPSPEKNRKVLQRPKQTKRALIFTILKSRRGILTLPMVELNPTTLAIGNHLRH